MAIIVHFQPTGMTASKYDTVIQLLGEAGLGAPQGRLHHVSYGNPKNLSVVDVYNSPQSFETFGQKLIPILVGQGIDVGQPVVEEVHGHVIG